MRRTGVGVLDTWARFEAWLARHAPELHAALPAGAADNALAKAEKAMRLTLPDDLKAVLRRRDGAPGVVGGFDLLSIEAIVRDRKLMREASAEIGHENEDPGPHAKPVHFAAKWIPIVSHGSGDFDCIDLDPGPAGRVGQLIRVFHDDDPRPLLASSFAAWLERIVDDVERGLYPFTNGDFAPWATGFSLSTPDGERRTRILSPGAPVTRFDASPRALELTWFAATQDVPADSPMAIVVRAGEAVFRERVAALPHDGAAYRLGRRYPAATAVSVAIEKSEPGLYILAFDTHEPVDPIAERGERLGLVLSLAARRQDAATAMPVLAELAAMGPLTGAARTALYDIPQELSKLCFALHEAKDPEGTRVADQIAGFAHLFADHPLFGMLADNCVVACIHFPELVVLEHVDAALVSRLPPFSTEPPPPIKQGRMVVELEAGPDAGARACFNLACLYARLGVPVRALHYAGLALERRMEPHLFRGDPDLASLRADPRFLAMLDLHAEDAERYFVMTTADGDWQGVRITDGVVRNPHDADDPKFREFGVLPAHRIASMYADTRFSDFRYLRPVSLLPDTRSGHDDGGFHGLPVGSLFAHPPVALHDVAAWQLLIEGGLDVRKQAVLVGPARAGHVDVLRFLLDAKANPNKATNITPLYGAASGGHEPAARLLLERGAKLPKALSDCARYGSLEGVRLLLKLGGKTSDLEPDARKVVIDYGKPAMRTLLKI